MEDFALWGTLVNVGGVLLGSCMGLGIRALGRIRRAPTQTAQVSNNRDKLSDTVLHGLALCALLVGIGGMLQGSVNDRISDAIPSLALSGEQTLIIILSMVLGAVIGHLLDLDRGINRLGVWIEDKTRRRLGNVAQGFVSASLLFCVGSMTIVGALNSGLSHDHSMLYTKSLLDTVSSIIFASTMGIGVMLSALFVLVYQGAIAVLAEWVAPLLSEQIIVTMSVTGSLLIVALSLNLLGLTKLKIMNYLPAIFLPIAIVPLWELLGI